MCIKFLKNYDSQTESKMRRISDYSTLEDDHEAVNLLFYSTSSACRWLYNQTNDLRVKVIRIFFSQLQSNSRLLTSNYSIHLLLPYRFHPYTFTLSARFSNCNLNTAGFHYLLRNYQGDCNRIFSYFILRF